MFVLAFRQSLDLAWSYVGKGVSRVDGAMFFAELGRSNGSVTPTLVQRSVVDAGEFRKR